MLFRSPPNGLDINFEYQRRTWVRDSVDPTMFKADVVVGADVPLFDRTLITRMLKMKWLESKGFDTTKPQDDFNQAYDFLCGKDQGAEILSAGRNGRSFPYLDSYRNTPDKGFGL